MIPVTTKSSLQQEPAPEIQGNLKTKVHLGLVVSGENIFALSRPKVDFSSEAQGFGLRIMGLWSPSLAVPIHKEIDAVISSMVCWNKNPIDF